MHRSSDHDFVLNLGFLPTKIAVPMSPILTDIVLILGAVSTVIAAFGAFFSPQQSWYLNAEVRAQLRALEAKLDFLERAPDLKKKETEILGASFAEYQTILADYNQKWQDLRQKSK
jgi:hypothetical protein